MAGIGAGLWVAETLHRGYRVPWINSQPPSLLTTSIRFSSYPPGSPKALAQAQEVSPMLEKSALEVVENSSPGFDSRIFLVEKASDSWRSVIDLSPLNQFAVQTGFKVVPLLT